MKINYDFYTGNDSYCDGDTEKDVISYLKEYGEEGYSKIFEKDIRWPVYYHITPIRKNILKWYPFKENAEVLEIGAGMGAITNILCDKVTHVTAVELSKQRASAIIERCQDKNNLELIIGNFNDIKFDKKFDYITLIGVLEYAPLYTNSDNPFKSFLDYIKTLLKDDGKLLIAIENSDQFDAIERRRISFQLQLCLEKIDSPYTFFWFDSHFVLIVNNLEETILEKVIDKMYKRSKKRMLTNSLYVGIGSQMSDLSQLILSYKRALAAVNMAMKFDYPIINFEEMGVYQILFSIEDKQILISMYYRLLQPLINYDQKHHSELEKTLYYYLVYDGSMQAMAKNLYMHRNTINYRMNKIKELLNCEFESIDEKMEYLLAFYIKKIMNAKKNRSS